MYLSQRHAIYMQVIRLVVSFLDETKKWCLKNPLLFQQRFQKNGNGRCERKYQIVDIQGIPRRGKRGDMVK
jgi:hypothetical protein